MGPPIQLYNFRWHHELSKANTIDFLLPTFQFSLYVLIWIFLFQGGSGLVGDDDSFGSGGAISARIESSYIVNLRDMDMKHVKDFTFLHGEF